MNVSGYGTFSSVRFSCRYAQFIGFKEEIGEEIDPVLSNQALMILLCSDPFLSSPALSLFRRTSWGSLLLPWCAVLPVLSALPAACLLLSSLNEL